MLSVSSSQHVLADANMKDASFFKSWIDHVIKRDRRDVIIRRAYKSRSLYHGLFGFGWCSELDAKIKIVDAEHIELSDCAYDQSIVYTKSPSAHKYIAQKKSRDEIILGANTYIRKQNGISTQRFSKSGEQMHDKAFIQNIARSEAGQITNIEFRDRTNLYYFYDDNSNLTVVKKNNDTMFQYKYDELHNLTQILYPDGGTENLTYNQDRDWIATYTDRKKCIENYSFETPDPRNPNYFVSKVNKKCPKDAPLETKYEFWHNSNSKNKLYLEKVKITTGASTKEISYNAQTGAANKITSRNLSRTAALEKYIKGEMHEVYQPELQKNN